jgi:hypothetical protein
MLHTKFEELFFRKKKCSLEGKSVLRVPRKRALVDLTII